MSSGLDISGCKKIASDKDSTTLRHPRGHKIKVAHKSLSVGMKKRLAGLPTHMAEGGDTEDMETAPPPEAGVMQKPATMPIAGTIDVHGDAPQKTTAQIAQEMNDHDLEFQRDLAKGHIQPDTYQSLYDKKDTLGKISTLFGLLVSGAGSGLAHQPNAVLQMMDNQIKNDFEAQKASNENTQNWYRLSQAHALQQAQIPQIEAQTALTQAQTGQIPVETSMKRAQIKNLDADNELKAGTNALNWMKIGAVKKLQDDVDKMSPGPRKDLALQKLGEVDAAVGQEVASSNVMTASQITARKALQNSAIKAKAPQAAIDMKKFDLLAKQGQINQEMGLPGGMRGPDVAEANKEASEVSENRALAAAYDDSFKRLNKAKLAGLLNPGMLAGETKLLNAEIARATAGRYVTAEAAAQETGILPNIKDWGEARPEKYRKTMQYFKNKEAGTTTLDRFGLKTPFPFSGELKEKRRKTVGGKLYEEGPNGEAIEVKEGK